MWFLGVSNIQYPSYTYILSVLDSWKFGTSTGCSARSQIFFLCKSFENCKKFSWDHRWSSHSQNIEFSKSCDFLLFWTYSTMVMCIYWVFWTFGVLLLARGALRHLRYFFSANHLRIVKSFPEITDEALIAKMWQNSKSCIFLQFHGILPWFYSYIGHF